MDKLTVYIPNLPERTDRIKSITHQFAGREEFVLHIVPAIRHVIGAYGQWKTFVSIVRKEAEKNQPYFIFCEDDHVFTNNYEFDYLTKCIIEADKYEADILCGGIGLVKDPIQCGEHLFWIRTFNGMQFTVIFRRFYQRILNSDQSEGYICDNYLSELSDNKFVMYPFISKQKEFGYSDITIYNNEKGHINRCFLNVNNTLKAVAKVKNYYESITTEL